MNNTTNLKTVTLSLAKFADVAASCGISDAVAVGRAVHAAGVPCRLSVDIPARTEDELKAWLAARYYTLTWDDEVGNYLVERD